MTSVRDDTLSVHTKKYICVLCPCSKEEMKINTYGYHLVASFIVGDSKCTLDDWLAEHIKAI